MKLLRTTPPERDIRKCNLIKTFVTVMEKISARPVFNGFVRSVPVVTSTVMAMKMTAMMALTMMPVRAMLMMAMTLRPRPLGPLGTARRASSPR